MAGFRPAKTRPGFAGEQKQRNRAEDPFAYRGTMGTVGVIALVADRDAEPSTCMADHATCVPRHTHCVAKWGDFLRERYSSIAVVVGLSHNSNLGR